MSSELQLDMSAASVAVVATSGERHEGKAGMVLFAAKNCVIHAWALCKYLGAKRRYINTLPFLSFYYKYKLDGCDLIVQCVHEKTAP